MALIAAAVVGSVAVIVPANGAWGATQPKWTFARYMTSNDPTHYYDLGKQLAFAVNTGTRSKDSVALLDFGHPERLVFGTIPVAAASFFAGGTQTVDRIQYLIERYARGYYDAITVPGAVAKIAPGTSNDFADSIVGWTDQERSQHGSDWQKMVDGANIWAATSGVSGRVSFAGANDMELGWDGPAHTRQWVSGWRNAGYGWNLFDFGGAAGCSQASGNYSACGTPAYPDWSSDDVWYIAWGVGDANPFPEIYVRGSPWSVQATQWKWLSIYGVSQKGSAPMNFVGAAAETASCGCTSENTPDQAWADLYNALNSDSRSADPDIRWSVNFRADDTSTVP
jgi:hypothetical protein